MNQLIQFPSAPADITTAAATLRAALAETELGLAELFAVFESWAAALSARELDAIPGVAFLRLWLRRGHLNRLSSGSWAMVRWPVIGRRMGARGSGHSRSG